MQSSGASRFVSVASDPLLKATIAVTAMALLPLAAVLAYALRAFHAARCGPGTYYIIAGWHPGLPTLIMVGCAGFAGASAILAAAASMQPADQELKHWCNRAARAALILAPLTLWAGPALVWDQYCLSARGADIQTVPWSSLHHYGWNLADRVATYCGRVKNGWDQKASIDFQGLTLSFPTTESYDGGWLSIYRLAALNLHGHRVWLDASAVSADCPEPSRDLLTHVP